MTYQLFGKFIFSTQILCRSGLHIGGSTTSIEIGGVENPVIKDPLTDQPYIPGSALKGKLRMLTEWSYGLIAKHSKHKSYAAYECPELKNERPSGNSEAQKWDYSLVVGRLYGAASDDEKIRMRVGPSRLTVRDSFLTEGSRKELEFLLGNGLFTEVKTENALDRVTSEANPRPIERVPSGARFALNTVLDVYEPSDQQLWRDLWMAMRLLEQSSLGGSGSRGHGQVEFQQPKLTWRSIDYYRSGSGEIQVALPADSIKGCIEAFDKITWPV